jgi:hypothetical protein
MKSNFLFACLTACPVVFCQAQSGLSVSSGSSLLIKSSNILSVDGIVLQPSSDFTINGSNSIARNTSLSHGASGTYIGRAFKLAGTVNAFSGSITIYYNDFELNGIPEGSLTLNVHNGTAWGAFTTGVTRDGVNNYVRTAGLSNVNLDEFTLADAMTALPLTWGDVTANRKGAGAFVKWQTYDESSTSYFEVERRTATTDWKSVGNRIAAFNTTGVHDYSLEDATVTQALTYYRIKQVDDNNRFTYSKVVSVSAVGMPADVNLYPNPAGHYVVVDAHQLKMLSVNVYSMDGGLVLSKPANGASVCVLDIARLPAGQYRLVARLSNGAICNQSFIKK